MKTITILLIQLAVSLSAAPCMAQGINEFRFAYYAPSDLKYKDYEKSEQGEYRHPLIANAANTVPVNAGDPPFDLSSIADLFADGLSEQSKRNKIQSFVDADLQRERKLVQAEISEDQRLETALQKVVAIAVGSNADFIVSDPSLLKSVFVGSDYVNYYGADVTEAVKDWCKNPTKQMVIKKKPEIAKVYAGYLSLNDLVERSPWLKSRRAALVDKLARLSALKEIHLLQLTYWKSNEELKRKLPVFPTPDWINRSTSISYWERLREGTVIMAAAEKVAKEKNLQLVLNIDDSYPLKPETKSKLWDATADILVELEKRPIIPFVDETLTGANTQKSIDLCEDAFEYLSVRDGTSASKLAVQGLNEIGIEGAKTPFGVFVALVAYFGYKQEKEETLAKQMLDQAKQYCDHKVWPYPIFDFVSGEITEAQLLSMAVTDSKKAQAQIFVGLNKSINGGDPKEIFNAVTELAPYGNPYHMFATDYLAPPNID